MFVHDKGCDFLELLMTESPGESVTLVVPDNDDLSGVKLMCKEPLSVYVFCPIHKHAIQREAIVTILLIYLAFVLKEEFCSYGSTSRDQERRHLANIYAVGLFV